VFFEFRIGAEVMLVNLAQVTRVKIAPPSGELVPVTFYFTDGHEEIMMISAMVLQRLSTAIPRSMSYGSGGMG
jgi:hypothetical protein